MPQSRSKVLLVDDDEDTRLLLAAVLTKRGFDVETCDSGSACLECLAREPASVVVTDVQMPGMSGIELCTIMREKYPHIVTIVVSGLATALTAAEAVNTGALTFLSKPITTPVLEAVLRKAIARTHVRD